MPWPFDFWEKNPWYPQTGSENHKPVMMVVLQLKAKVSTSNRS